MTDPSIPVLTTISRASIAETIAEQIENLILRGEIGPGAKLPSEESMAKSFQVSRPAVREGLAILRGRRLVESLDGSGNFVVHPQTADLGLALSRHLEFAGVPPETIRNLYEVRSALEIAAAGMAAQRADPDDHTAICDWLGRLRDARADQRSWTDAVVGLHIAVATATKNPFVATLLESLVVAIAGVISEGYRDPAAVDLGLLMHQRLVEAIVSGNAEASEQAMREMLAGSHSYVLEMMATRERNETESGASPEQLQP